MKRAVKSASKMYLNNDNIDIIYLYLEENSNVGYILKFTHLNKTKEKLISDCKEFNKKMRNKITNKIKKEDLDEVIFVDLLDEEKLDFLEKLKGNF